MDSAVQNEGTTILSGEKEGLGNDGQPSETNFDATTTPVKEPLFSQVHEMESPSLVDTSSDDDDSSKYDSTTSCPAQEKSTNNARVVDEEKSEKDVTTNAENNVDQTTELTVKSAEQIRELENMSAETKEDEKDTDISQEDRANIDEPNIEVDVDGSTVIESEEGATEVEESTSCNLKEEVKQDQTASEGHVNEECCAKEANAPTKTAQPTSQELLPTPLNGEVETNESKNVVDDGKDEHTQEKEEAAVHLDDAAGEHDTKTCPPQLVEETTAACETEEGYRVEEETKVLPNEEQISVAQTKMVETAEDTCETMDKKEEDEEIKKNGNTVGPTEVTIDDVPHSESKKDEPVSVLGFQSAMKEAEGKIATVESIMPRKHVSKCQKKVVKTEELSGEINELKNKYNFVVHDGRPSSITECYMDGTEQVDPLKYRQYRNKLEELDTLHWERLDLEKRLVESKEDSTKEPIVVEEEDPLVSAAKSLMVGKWENSDGSRSLALTYTLNDDNDDLDPESNPLLLLGKKLSDLINGKKEEKTEHYDQLVPQISVQVEVVRGRVEELEDKIEQFRMAQMKLEREAARKTLEYQHFKKQSLVMSYVTMLALVSYAAWDYMYGRQRMIEACPCKFMKQYNPNTPTEQCWAVMQPCWMASVFVMFAVVTQALRVSEERHQRTLKETC